MDNDFFLLLGFVSSRSLLAFLFDYCDWVLNYAFEIAYEFSLLQL